MALKIVIPENERTVTVGGLYQWDYGQVLEIECVEIGSEIVEVHFACMGMAEAIVRPCTFANGIGAVIIPDRCLEQASNITAWVYRIVKDVADDGTEIVIQGQTVKTITLPVIARTRPSKSYDNISSGDIDKYKEALVEINEAVNALENGNVTVAKAQTADNAGYATTADSAKNATYASSAGSAASAGTANKAARIIVSPDYPYYSISLSNGRVVINKSFSEGLFLVTYVAAGVTLSGVAYIGTNSGSLKTYCIGLGKIAVLYEESAGGVAEVSLIDLTDSSPTIPKNGTLTFIRIGEIAHG